MRCHKPLKVPISTYKFNSRSRPSDNGGGGVSGHPDPEIGRGQSQNFFSPFGPQFGLKIRVGRGGGPSLDPPLKFSRLISIHFLEELLSKFDKTSKHFFSGYHFINSHNLSSSSCTDFVRRKLMLVTLGTQCKSQFHT